MSKVTKAQATKIVEGFNYEVQTHNGQYKYRNGTLAMRGSDIARRNMLRNNLEHGKPYELAEVTIEQIDQILAMEAADDAWFTKQAGF